MTASSAANGAATYAVSMAVSGLSCYHRCLLPDSRVSCIGAFCFIVCHARQEHGTSRPQCHEEAGRLLEAFECTVECDVMKLVDDRINVSVSFDDLYPATHRSATIRS